MSRSTEGQCQVIVNLSLKYHMYRTSMCEYE